MLRIVPGGGRLEVEEGEGSSHMSARGAMGLGVRGRMDKVARSRCCCCLGSVMCCFAGIDGRGVDAVDAKSCLVTEA